MARRGATLLIGAFVVGCGGDDATTSGDGGAMTAAARLPVSAQVVNATQQAFVGAPFEYDATQNGTTFNNPRGAGLKYTTVFAPSANGIASINGRLSGTPLVAMTMTVTITATDNGGSSATSSFRIVVSEGAPVALVSANAPQGTTVGAVFNYDATKAGTAFSGSALTYAVTFAPTTNGLTAANGRISGTVSAPGIMVATIVARDGAGNTISNAFPIVAFSADLAAPTLPASLSPYADASSPLPAHFLTVAGGRGGGGGGGGSVVGADNTPINNATTDAGATLGRVLFYDRRLSVNDRVACASCHQQQFAFGDTAKLSRGFSGGVTDRHSMALANARFYSRGRFFWDERAATLEDQVLQPIQNSVEMGMSLDNLITKLSLTGYYAPLFQSAFGSPDITSAKISRALAQFVRSLVSGNSKFDRAFTGGVNPNFNAVLSAQELQGQGTFNGRGNCAQCHATNAQISDDIHNNGLDATLVDAGAGQGRFKAPSLRNVEVRGRFMHDGRFTSLEQVVEFYNSGVQSSANLDGRLGGRNGANRLNLSQADKDALVAYMKTFTDNAFLTAAKFSNPFPR